MLFPLDFVYARSGVELPHVRAIDPDDISHPTVFLSVTPNPEMMGVFWMREPKTLYGRRTVMRHQGVKIGDIVEVLPLV